MAQVDRGQASAAARAGRIVTVAAVIVVLAALIHSWSLAGSQRYPFPYSDVWIYVGPYLDDLTWTKLLAPHNEHVVATTKLALWLDQHLDHMQMEVACGINLGLAGAAAALVVWVGWRRGDPVGTAASMALALGLAGISAVMIAGFAFFLAHLAFVFLAVVAAILLQPRAVASAGARPLAIRVALAIAALLIAQASSGSSATIGISLALLLCLLPRSVPRRRAWLIAATMLLAAVVQWWLLYRYLSALPRALPDFGAAALYILQLLGTPLALMATPGDAAMGLAGGVFSLAVALLAAWRVLRHRELLFQPAGWIAASLLLAVGASVVGVALIRAGGVFGPFDVKYLHYAVVLLASSLVLLVLPTSGKTMTPSPARTAGCIAALVLLVAMNTALSLTLAVERAQALRAMRTSIPGFQLIAEDPQLQGYFEPADDFARYQLMLRERQLAHFAPGADRLIGNTLERVTSLQSGACTASIYQLVPLRSRDPGRAHDGVLRVDLVSFADWVGADTIVFTISGEQRIVGYALVLSEFPREPNRAVSTSWRGYLALDPAAAAYDVWLLDNEAEKRCLADTFAPP